MSNTQNPQHPLLAAARPYIDTEVSGGTRQRPTWSQNFGDVFQGEGGGADPHGEADHQESSGTSEGPAVSRMDVWLQVSNISNNKNETSVKLICHQFINAKQNKRNVELFCSFLSHSAQ